MSGTYVSLAQKQAKKTLRKHTTKKTIPRTVVTFCIKASKPRAFCFENNSSAPPLKADIASLCFEGCIITAIIINTLTTNKIVINKLYKEMPPRHCNRSDNTDTNLS